MWWAWKKHLSFMFISVLLWSGVYSGSCTGTQVMNVSPSGLSLGGIPEGYSDRTLDGIRGNQGFNGEELDISQGCHQVYPWCISIHPVLVIEPGGTSRLPVSVRGRLSMTRKEKLWCKVCLHSHLEQGWTPPVERGHWLLFFSLTDGR